MSRIKLGNEVRCIITGFEGIATSRIEYLNGEIEYGITPQHHDKGYPKVEWISASRIQKVSDGVHLEHIERRAGFYVEERKG